MSSETFIVQSIEVSLIGFLLVLLGIVCEDKYEVNIFKGITEVRSDGVVPYLKEHPDADTDAFSAERRLELCREGYKHVSLREEGKDFVLLKSDEIGKLKAYVLVNSPVSDDLFGDDIVQVRPAYTCPTSPPTYIHVNRDHEDATIFWVMLKIKGPVFSFGQIKTYQLYFPEDVREANVEGITRASAMDIMNSHFDTDILTDDLRLQMCRRGMSIAPEIGVEESESRAWGTSKYYALWEVGAGDDSTTGTGYWQAFACPTTPVMYIHTLGIDDDHLIFWPFVQKSEIKQLPALNMMAYELIIANSIVAQGFSRPEPEADNRGVSPCQRTVNEATELLKATSSATDNATAAIDRIRLAADHSYQVRKEKSAINTDKLKIEDRLNLCAKAISTVFGQTAKFATNESSRSRWYCYKYLIIPEIDAPFTRVVEGFPCPTTPMVYVHVTEPMPTGMFKAQIIILRDDLDLPFAQ